MKHSRNDYNRIQDPLNLIPENEPVFLVRGQDVLAVPVLIRYREGLITNGGDTPQTKELVDSIEQHINLVRQWQQNNEPKMCDLLGDYDSKKVVERAGEKMFSKEQVEDMKEWDLSIIEKLKTELEEMKLTNKVLVELIELKKKEQDEEFAMPSYPNL